MMNGNPLPDQYKVDPRIGGKFYDTIGPFFKYLKKKATPLPESDSEKCDNYGICVNEYPTGSIKFEDKAIPTHTMINHGFITGDNQTGSPWHGMPPL